MIKSISIEKLQIEMKKFNLKGTAAGLWTIKNAVDLYKDDLYIGGSKSLLIFSILILLLTILSSIRIETFIIPASSTDIIFPHLLTLRLTIKYS